jgi:hypothetical protein
MPNPNEIRLASDRLQLPQTAGDVKAHIQLIQQVMAESMIKDVHYGVIPGTQRPTLYKAGANLLLTTFRISVLPEVHDLSTPDEIRYRVHAQGVHVNSGHVIGIGVGECSTSEEKYRWRDAVCEQEWDETPENRRRVKYARGRDRTHYTRIQVRTVPADLANTVLKMAKKRAETDLCLTGLACSDVFAQDLEDTTDHGPAQPPTQPDPKAGSKAPQRKQAPKPESTAPQPPTAVDEAPATQHQVGVLMATADRAGVSERELMQRLEITGWEALKAAQVNGALAWLRTVNS